MISVKDLRFSYTNRPFIEDMSFDVRKGEIFGFLGPSGAGKSTLQKILTGLLTNYQGSVKVNGIEVKNHDNGFYEDIGVDFEFPSLYEKLTARENLRFFSSIFVGKRGYVISRLIFPAVISFAFSVLLTYFFSLTDWDFMMLSAVSLLMSLSSTAAALFIFSFSRNRVEGMAMAKMASLIFLGLVVPFFVWSDAQYFASFIPSF